LTTQDQKTSRENHGNRATPKHDRIQVHKKKLL
jgi:hypothetical protein